jgi:teichuronic acid biosynthesis glycosyltransferase TuaH
VEGADERAGHKFGRAKNVFSIEMHSGPGAALVDRPVLDAPAADDVVFTFSYLTWGAAARRGWFGTEDRLARGLVAHEGLRRVLVCDRTRSLPLKLLRERLAREDTPFPADERRALLAPVRLRRSDPSSLRGVARGFAAYDRAIERGARNMGLEKPVVITTHPLVAGFAELSWARAVTYYALDDWTVHPAYRRWWPAYRESYARIRARGRRVAAVSEVLLRRLAPTTPGVVIPNGLEPLEWMSGGRDAEDCGLAGSPGGDPAGPLLVYAGTLDARLDVAWLAQTARALPEATLALVGPLIDAPHLRPLRSEPNIAIHPPLPRTQLAGLIRRADVGLVPHRRSALTEAMSPLKLYEYLAGGLPVAATDLEPMRGIDPRVILVPEGGDFAAAARAALALGRTAEPQRHAFVQANSWRSRHDALLELALA